jgi:hypothetical protein
MPENRNKNMKKTEKKMIVIYGIGFQDIKIHD